MDGDDRTGRPRSDPDFIRRSGSEWREMRTMVTRTEGKVDRLNDLLVDPQYGAVPRLEKKVDGLSATFEQQISNAQARRTARISGETVKLIVGILATAVAMLIVFLVTSGHA